MKFRIVPDGNGGFTVVWIDMANSDKTFLEVEGFATHEAAESFVQSTIIKLAKAFAKVN